MKYHIFTLLAAITCCLSGYAQTGSLAAPPEDGRKLEVQKINKDVNIPVLIPEIFAEEGITYQNMDVYNFGRKPVDNVSCAFAIAYTDDAILIHYKVCEPSVRAVAPGDNERPWEDSCCEFFSSPDPENDRYYYNLEANCTGRILIEFGLEKGGREKGPQDVLSCIKRWATLEGEPFEGRMGQTAWQMALIIPFREYYFHHDIQTLEGRTIRANFYNCGDLLPVPHSQSWSPIYPPGRHFHTPDFFGTLFFKP